MKKHTLIASALVTLFSTNAAALTATFAEGAWNDAMIPEGQQCQKFGGVNPATPALHLSDIPAGATAVVLEYSDLDYEKMNNGGHGRMSFALTAGLTAVDLPSVPGHSFELPAGFSLIEAHRSPGWDKAGAYMPPCSGGKGHIYSVTVKAVAGDKVMAETTLEMGKY